MQVNHGKAKTAVSLVVHQLISTIGVIILSALLTFLLYSVFRLIAPSFTTSGASWILTEVPGFPVQIAFGLIVGFVLGRYTRHRIMTRVWILPLTILCFAALFVPKVDSSLFSHFFGGGCSPSNRCFDQLLFTLPCVASAAYASGAKLAAL